MMFFARGAPRRGVFQASTVSCARARAPSAVSASMATGPGVLMLWRAVVCRWFAPPGQIDAIQPHAQSLRTADAIRLRLYANVESLSRRQHASIRRHDADARRRVEREAVQEETEDGERYTKRVDHGSSSVPADTALRVRHYKTGDRALRARRISRDL
jgi:hypothetical protein